MISHSPLARSAAGAVAFVHVAFVAFALLGGFLAWRNASWAWFHLPVAAWSVAIFASGRECPLTPLEKRLRRYGGGPGYTGGFVEHYLLRRRGAAPLGRTGKHAISAGIAAWTAVVYAFGFAIAN